MTRFRSLGEAAHDAGIFARLDRLKRKLDRAADGALEGTDRMKIHLLEAEHFSTSGRVVMAFSENSTAIAAAVEIVNKMIEDTRKVAVSGFGDTANVETWESVLEILQDYHGAAHCYVTVSELTVETNPRRWSFLITWWDGDDEQGDYAWSGEADDRNSALASAYEQMWVDNESGDEDETFDLDKFSNNRSVIEEWHGTDPWA